MTENLAVTFVCDHMPRKKLIVFSYSSHGADVVGPWHAFSTQKYD